MKNSELSPAAVEARRAYKRQWAHDHPDKIREQRRRYWERQGELLQQARAAEAAEADGGDDAHDP